MAKWGKCDFKQLERLNKNMEKLMGADLDRFCRQAAQELAGRLLNKVVKRTPVVYGTLRDAWAVMPVGHRGTHYTVVVLKTFSMRPMLNTATGNSRGGSSPVIGKVTALFMIPMRKAGWC